MKFKVGDKVKGISNTYGITNTDMYLGEVKKVGDDYIEILILKHKNPRCIGDIYTALRPEGKFEIVDNLTISQLQSEIDKLSNEIGNYHNKIHSMRDRNNYMKEQLKELIKESKKEENKPILDDAEKEYLNAVIRPFKIRVKCISKETTCIRNHYIFIDLGSDDIALPIFSNKTMYKGMEADKKYTLKELGLDE